jgi:hypothetical protein
LSSAEESLRRAEELLERLESARGELERLASSEDTEGAIDVLTELADLAKQVEAELTSAKTEADVDAQR